MMEERGKVQETRGKGQGAVVFKGAEEATIISLSSINSFRQSFLYGFLFLSINRQLKRRNVFC